MRLMMKQWEIWLPSCLNHLYSQFEVSFNYIDCMFKSCKANLKVVAPLYYKILPKTWNILIIAVTMDCLHCRKYSILFCFVTWLLLDGHFKYRKNFGGSIFFYILNMIFWQELCQNQIYCNSLPAVRDDFLAGASSKSKMSPTFILTRCINGVSKCLRGTVELVFLHCLGSKKLRDFCGTYC